MSLPISKEVTKWQRMNIHWNECKCDKYPLDHGACPFCMEEEE